MTRTIYLNPWNIMINFHIIERISELDDYYNAPNGSFASVIPNNSAAETFQLTDSDGEYILGIAFRSIHASSGEVASAALQLLHFIYAHEGMAWNIWEDKRQRKELEFLTDEAFEFLIDIEKKANLN